MALAQLLQPRQLAERLGTAKLILLDCRFALEDPDHGRRAYAQGHIPGAHFLDLAADLSGIDTDGESGRHPLPDPQQLLQRLRACGCSADSQIVLYDDGPGAFAARAWWLLAWLGKRDGVWLLDGGFKAWQNEGLALCDTMPGVASGTLDGTPDQRLLINAAELLERLQDSSLCLLDARAEPRFRGEVEPIDPIAGHIPRAQCAPFTDNLASDGRFLAPTALRQRFAALLGERRSEDLVAYCGSGVTACHNLFALCLAGYPLATLYAASWSGWICDPTRPLARADHP